MVAPNGDIYDYEPSEGTCTYLFSTGMYSVDVANTDTKLWVNGGSGMLREFNITLDPFTYSFSRDITVGASLGAGLTVYSADDITETYVLLAGISYIRKFTITPGGTSFTTLFSLGTNRYVTGDIIYNASNNTYLVSNTQSSFSNSYYITEYDEYGTVISELTIPYSNIYGLFEYEGLRYAVRGTKEFYEITSGGLIYVGIIPTIIVVNGASQNVTCIGATTTTLLPT